MPNRIIYALPLVLLLFLAACGGPTAEPTATSVPAPTPEPKPVDWSKTESRPVDGYYELGNPDAAIVIIDYSDFL